MIREHEARNSAVAVVASLLLCLVTGSTLSACAIQVNPPGAAVDLDQVGAQLDQAQLRVHFIDIGPGLAAFIQTPNNRRTIFVDGGKWGVAKMEEYVKKFLPENSVMHLAIVTHADLDHYQGMNRIFNSFQVREFWYTGYTSNKLGPMWTQFLQRVLAEEDCQTRNPIGEWKDVGDVVTIDNGDTPGDTSDDVKIVLLNVDAQPPERDFVSGRTFKESQRRNNASLVFKLIYGEVSFLFTGDINGRNKNSANDDEIDSEELELWVRHTLNPDKFSLDATVLQAPHHGSNGSCSKKFIQAVKPEWVVIPAGYPHNHPTKGALKRIKDAGVLVSHTLRTDQGETDDEKDARGDDCYVFQANGQEVTQILRVKIN